MPSKNVEEIISSCISLTKCTKPVVILNGLLYKWEGYVTDFLVGSLELYSFPCFSLVISDCSGYIPCIISDPTRYIRMLLELYNRKVILRRPQFITETYIIDGNEQNYVFLYVRGCDVHLTFDDEQENNNSSSSNCSTHRQEIRNVYDCRHEEYILKLLHISSIILSYKEEPYCFILVSILQPVLAENEKIVWIILKNEQVSLSNFLIADQVCRLVVSQIENNQNYFMDRVPLMVIFQNFSRRFKDMIHHDDLIISLKAVFLPSNAKMWIMPKNFFPNSSGVNNKNSFTDKTRVQRKFVSVCGVINDLWYAESWKNRKCPYCDEIIDNRNESGYPDISDRNDSSVFTREMDAKSNGEILIPSANSVKSARNKLCPLGIRNGKISIRINLYDSYTKNMVSVYLSDWKHQLYPFGLLRNATVRFTNVCVKKSKRGNVYYISTPLTQLLHLDLKSTDKMSNILAVRDIIDFGFSQLTSDDVMMWVPLDVDVITKLSISKRCNRCKFSAFNYKCTNVSCPEFLHSNEKNYETQAFIKLLVKGVNTNPDFQITLNDEEARRYLDIPINIWASLASLSFQSEFLYLSKNQETYDLNETRYDFYRQQINECLQNFCVGFMPTKRYHAVCRPIRTVKNTYICVELNEIDSSRLSVMHKICNNL